MSLNQEDIEFEVECQEVVWGWIWVKGEWELSLRCTVERFSACKPENHKKMGDFIDIAESRF